MKTLKTDKEPMDENELLHSEEESWRPTPLVGGSGPTDQEGKAGGASGEQRDRECNVVPSEHRFRKPEDPFFPPLW